MGRSRVRSCLLILAASPVRLLTPLGVMACKSSEAFIFFNIDGVRRIAGLAGLSPVLVELLGSRERAEKLLLILQGEQNVQRREKLVLDSYREAVGQDMGVIYTVPFRVESEQQQRTSHYFIHATNHRLGFKIMKEVMWNYGHSEHGQGGLEFVQAVVPTTFRFLIRSMTLKMRY